MDRYTGKYKNVRQVALSKGDSGWGIMILEGKHSVAGTGVFVSDMQAGSCAEKAGLMRGDMILAVDGNDFVGVNYETAAKILKTLEGTISMIVANANIDNAPTQAPPLSNTVKPSISSPARAAGAGSQPQQQTPAAPVSPDKPKLPPKPALAPKPLSPVNKPTLPLSSTAASTVPAPKKSPEGPTTLRSNVSAGVGSDRSVPPFFKTCLKIFYPYKFYFFRTKSTKKPVASPRRRGGGGSTPAGADPPATCEISPGADTTIEITKDKDEDGKPMGLGLSIVGGSDTLLGAIFIHEVSRSYVGS